MVPHEFPFLSRRQWFGSALTTCAGVALAGLADAQDVAPLPVGYTKPTAVEDLTRAPGMQVRQISAEANGQRTYAVIFAKGDEVLSGLTAFAAQEKITSAFFASIGAFQHAKFGWFDAAKKAYRDVVIGEQAELIPLVGHIGLVNGKGQAHAHGAVSLPDGTLRGGHLLEAVVWPTVEIFCTVLPAALTKEEDPETGLNLFNLKAGL